MARQALGRGLSALLGDESADTANNDFLDLDIELIVPNKDQPRTNFPEAELAELTQSIRTNGVVQPIIVRKAKKGDGYQLVAGERRWRAAQRAELKKIPALVRDIDDAKMLEIALIENIQRQELNPVEESSAYKKLIDDLGLTQQAVADRVGKTRAFIANYLRLLNLPKPILNLLSEGKISVGHAKAILSIENPTRQKQLAAEIVAKGLSVRQAENAAKRSPAAASAATQPKPLDPNLRSAETKLRRRFGTQVRIKPSSVGESGKLEFDYYSSKDLDRIYNLLLGKK